MTDKSNKYSEDLDQPGHQHRLTLVLALAKPNTCRGSFEPGHKKMGFLHMRKQRRRSAMR